MTDYPGQIERPTDEDDEDARTDGLEEEALGHARVQLHDFVDELTELAEALLRVASGTAGQADLALVRGSIDGRGLLLCEHAADWNLLLRWARGAAS